jgi:hypothetical protein
MNGPLVAATAARRFAVVRGVRLLAIVLAAAGLAAVAGCGGDERLSRQEFADRLERMERQGGELWGRLAERAEDIQPNDPLPADIEQPTRELVEFQREAADELEDLNPPRGADQDVRTLIDALRARTENLEHAMQAGYFTEQESDQITQSGETIDEAFEQLRNEGFLPKVNEHEHE